MLPDVEVDANGGFYYIYAVEDGGTWSDPSDFLSSNTSTSFPRATRSSRSRRRGHRCEHFTPGSFVLNNTGDVDIVSASIDLDTSFFPDVHYDPAGTAGDLTASCFAVASGAAETGLTTPSATPDSCTVPYSGVTPEGGFSTLTLGFTDFNGGETIAFNSDVDPLSITGFAVPATPGPFPASNSPGDRHHRVR